MFMFLCFLSVVGTLYYVQKNYSFDVIKKKSTSLYENAKFMLHYVTKDTKDLKNMYLNNVTIKGNVSLIEFKSGRYIALPTDEKTKMASLRYEIFVYFKDNNILNITPPMGYTFIISPLDFGAEKICIMKDTITIVNTAHGNKKIKFPPEEAYQDEVLID